MKKAGYKRHVFVCLNERAPDHPRGCCKQRGSEEIFKALKEGAKKAGLKDDEVRINRAGCLEHCEYGPTRRHLPGSGVVPRAHGRGRSRKSCASTSSAAKWSIAC